WSSAAAALDARVAAVLEGAPPSPPALASINAALMQSERDLLNPAGLPGRPWFRHLIYAPLPSYAAETLPGLREAVADNDAARAASQTAALAAAIRARTATVRKAVGAIGG